MMKPSLRKLLPEFRNHSSSMQQASATTIRRRAQRRRWIDAKHSSPTPLSLMFSTMIVALLGVGRVIDGRGLEVEVQHAPCVRLFHSNGDVGCRTESREGVVGALLAVENYEQLREIEKIDLLQYDSRVGVQEINVGDNTHYLEGDDGLVIVMPTRLFNATSLTRLSATGLLAGVLLVKHDDNSMPADAVPSEQSAGYSPAVKTPQGDSTPTASFDVDSSYPWNARGDGLLMQSLNFPVVLVGSDSGADVWDRAVSNGRVGGTAWRYPLHKARMVFYFGGSGENLNSQACLGWENIKGERAPQCLPLGGQSAWASVGPAGEGGKEAVFAVAGMDATSTFHDLAPGANAAASGLVALLAAAESIGAAGRSGTVDLKGLPRQIVFAAFQAEAYGFTGSRRFVKDREEGIACQNRVDASVSPSGREACLDPLYPSLEFLELGKPAQVISVDQVGYLPDDSLYIHRSPGSSNRDRWAVERVSVGGGVGGTDAEIGVANATRGELPPTPLTSFVKADSAQSGFVIAGYDEHFASPHYHSITDTREKVKASSVAAAATLLAKSALASAGAAESSAQGLEVNATLVETLLDCMTENWMCETFLEYVGGEIANMEKALGIRVRVDAAFPPTLYTAPLEFRNGGGLPTVRHTAKDGSWRLHPKWSEDFDPNMDKIQLVPSILEMFCRAFLSEQAGSGYSGGFGKDECQSSGDCPAADCVEGTPELGGGVSGEEGRAGADSGAGAGAKAECVRGRCACQFGFHHIALDVGLEREEVINQYKVLDVDLTEQGVGLWTEVNWKNIGVEVFLDPGKAAGKVAVGLGTIVTAVAGIGSWVLLQSLSKRKLL